MDAITEKRKKKSRKYKKEQEQEKHSAEEKSTFHCKWNTNGEGALKFLKIAKIDDFGMKATGEYAIF